MSWILWKFRFYFFLVGDIHETTRTIVIRVGFLYNFSDNDFLMNLL